MSNIIYCDESCHLRAQGGPMVLGAIKVPADKRYAVRDAIRGIKARYGIKDSCEMKWTKISSSRLDAYLDLVRYFFSCNDLSYRALLAPLDGLDPESFGMTYDDWYYHMYFYLLSPMISNDVPSDIYVDVKDTNGARKVRKLHNVICNSELDFNRSLIRRVQEIQSHEVELMSIVDILSGALTHLHRGLTKSPAKDAVISEICGLSGLSLRQTTLISASKFNLFIWRKRNV